LAHERGASGPACEGSVRECRAKMADVLYVNFKKPSHADDSDITDDDVIIRYEKGQVVGMTFLNASKRQRPQG